MTPHMTATELYWKLSAVTSGDMVFPEVGYNDWCGDFEEKADE